ncbi:histone deacetylase family protein [Billgrantia kenyensis]|uniref:Histone deacetylase family protein n=1 Tax=Billgrantia kenyensis TaxID=321266 RepID=A0A7V9W082_9GAMM|nr:histone deacetylase family protein [Halomonas kenyensis]MBA2778668.1 histone deacetylase family protein [Halomonas kenyensis]MCG6661528.1 histone deacetylase family protein [Halomonas kenyensis]
MITFHSEATKLRRALTELNEGLLVAPFECPERVDLVLGRVREVGLSEVRSPTRYGLEPVLAVHDACYVEFLASCWEEWKAIGMAGEAIPNIWPSRSMPGRRIPEHIEGRLGYYAQTGETSICANTFEAADISKDIALSALVHTLKTGEPSFGLCRPPGHHASSDQFGGYCFFNNAAIAADQALKHGRSRVAVLDVDFHHGNGTQEIFYARDDVIFVSLHGDPLHCFPYYLGHANETGSGRGEGFNHNYPMPPGTDYAKWSTALDDGLARIRESGAELLIVSLGVDTFERDPISSFKLASEDYLDMGRRLAGFGLPTVFLLEGGYAVEEIGINVVNVLSGFDEGQA